MDWAENFLEEVEKRNPLRVQIDKKQKEKEEQRRNGITAKIINANFAKPVRRAEKKRKPEGRSSSFLSQ